MYTTESRAKKWGGRNETRGGREARGEVSGVCAWCVLQKSCTGIMHTQRHVEPRFL